MKIFKGKVVSTKMDKTATVLVEYVIAHPVYKKRIKKKRKYHVHDELGVEVGQKVCFIASKPYSRTKRWKITEIIDNKKKPASKKNIKKSKGSKK